MGYDFKIFWSDRVLKDPDNILDYLISSWSEKEIEQFKSKLFRRIELIGSYPMLFRASLRKPSLRRSVLSKQTSIFYLVDDENSTINIVSLFDNRMDPDKT